MKSKIALIWNSKKEKYEFYLLNKPLYIKDRVKAEFFVVTQRITDEQVESL